MARTAVLSDSVLEQLAGNPAAVARLPHLLNPIVKLKRTMPVKSCGKCDRGERAQLAALISRIRHAIPALSPQDRATLKSVLNVERIEVSLADHATGRVTPFAF